MFGQPWLTARGLTGGLLLVSTLLVGVGINMFGWIILFPIWCLGLGRVLVGL